MMIINLMGDPNISNAKQQILDNIVNVFSVAYDMPNSAKLKFYLLTTSEGNLELAKWASKRYNLTMTPFLFEHQGIVARGFEIEEDEHFTLFLLQV